MAKTASDKGGNQPSEGRVYQLIVEELDMGRDVLQLYRQVSKALPVKSFDDLKKAADKEGNIHFRDLSVPISLFEDLIPEFLFPIADANSLIAALVQLVQAFPQDVGYDASKPETQKMMSKRQFASSLLPFNSNIRANALAADDRFQLSTRSQDLEGQLLSK